MLGGCSRYSRFEEIVVIVEGWREEGKRKEKEKRRA